MFGAHTNDMHEIHLDQIFLLRLKLLIIMARAFLDGCPIEPHRKRAIINNAMHIKNEAVELGGLASKLPGGYNVSGEMDFGYIFYQRVKLLAVMAISFAEGNPMTEHRKEALDQNLTTISEALTFSSNISEIEFLKVA